VKRKQKSNRNQKTTTKSQKEKKTSAITNDFLFKKKDAYICAGIFLLTLIVYMLTLAPSVFFGDSGELTAAAYNMGIAHPPGYPLYLMLGKLFMLSIPFGDMAMRMNLLSAVFAAATAAVIFLISGLLMENRLIAFMTSLMAVFSATFWSQAVITEVYTLAAFFFCNLILLMLLWFKDQHPRWLILMAFTAGLAMTHHVIIVIFLPVYLVFVLLEQPKLLKDWKLIIKCMSLFLFPLLLYLYLPIQSAINPPNDWGNPETLSAMINHITAQQFGGLFLKHAFAGVAHQFSIFIHTLLKQFPFLLLILPFVGLWATKTQRHKDSIISKPSVVKNNSISTRKRILFLLSLSAIALFYSIAYFITDIEPHFIYFFIILALFIGMGLNYFYGLTKSIENSHMRRLAIVTLIIIALLPLAFNWNTCNQKENYLARHYGMNIINSLDQDGILFIDSETELFIAAYLKIVEKLRPDVKIYDVRQNIFFVPPTKEKKEATVKDLYQYALQMVKDLKPVYFTNPIFSDFKYRDHGVLFKVVPGLTSNARYRDPWQEYDLMGLHNNYHDAESREVVGKYYYSRAKSFAQSNQPDQAKEFLVKALTAAGDRHKVLKYISMFYMGSREHSEAEKLLKKAIKINPFDPDQYNMLGMIAHFKLNRQEALNWYGNAIRLNVQHMSALTNRGTVYEQMGDKESHRETKKDYYQKALEDLQQAKQMEPQNKAVSDSINRITYKISQ
jgi:tetratricopeptide (TPR) repeat protein